MTRPTTARLLVAARVRPHLRFSLYVAERLRAAVIRWTQTVVGDGAALQTAVTGHDTDGEIATGHQHLHVFCEPDGAHPNVAALILHVPGGIPQEMEAALRRPGLKLYDADQMELPLVLASLGTAAELGGHSTDRGQSSLLATGKTWVSVTPFVPTRHAKKKLVALPAGLQVYRAVSMDAFDNQQRIDLTAPDVAPEQAVREGDAISDLLRLLAENYPQCRPTQIVQLQQIPVLFHGTQSTKTAPCADFRTIRRDGGGARAATNSCGFHLTFAAPQTGPLALGYGAHYSLGLFRALPDQES